MYALIDFAGKQFRIEEGGSIKVPYIGGKVGNKVIIDKILYLDDGKTITVGTPLVTGIKIDGEITSHGKGKKVVVFKFKRRKGYQKKNTHRQEYSILKVGKFGKVKKDPSEKVATKIAETKTAPKKETAAKKKPAAKKPVKKETLNKVSVQKTVATKATPAKPKETNE